ncbi:sialin-like [Lineus longissimus]|uniref:sialin-like n=1 Tax=Lineus longissimus TaxID=88925 RepID=UPI00315CCBF3
MTDHGKEDTPLIKRNKQVVLTPKGPDGCFQQRYILSCLAFFGFFNVFALRVNLSVALVAMVNQTKLRLSVNTSDECDYERKNQTDPLNSRGEFNWSPETQELILAAFYYGYIITQIPGGLLAERYGGKWPFGIGVLATGVLTLLSPIVAKTSVYLFIALRVAVGLCEGLTFPSIHSMMGKWVPPLERSRLVSLAYSGMQIGVVVSQPISGLLCQYGFAGGWPSVFYVFGLCACVWFIFWCFLVYDSPYTHPRISAEEKEYILTSIGDCEKHQEPTPWRHILRSRSVWCLVVTHMCGSYGYHCLLTNLPTYMKTILHFNMNENAFLSSLPYLMSFMTQWIAGAIADFLITKRILYTVTVRKLFTSLGMFGPAAFLFAAGYVGCNYAAAVILLTLSISMNGFAVPGFLTNIVEIAPKFAGSVNGLVNTFGTAAGIISPAVVGALTNNNQTQGQWRIIFIIASCTAIFGGIVYIIFAKGEREFWSYSRKSVIYYHGLSDKERARLLSIARKNHCKTVETNNKEYGTCETID